MSQVRARLFMIFNVVFFSCLKMKNDSEIMAFERMVTGIVRCLINMNGLFVVFILSMLCLQKSEVFSCH